MPSAKLFPTKRTCCVCFIQVNPITISNKGKPQPVVLAISSTLYRGGAGKRSLQAAKRVQVCENCFVKILASDTIDEGLSLFAALMESLRNRYSAMIGEVSSL
jgi:hypothetical protein